MNKQTIHLGFEVGTGNPVEIPMRHTAVTGQTQESGKTTTLEALISRSGCRAVTFVTKRGEASFTSARRIRPYFREQADWQYVAAILEAYRSEKMRYERPWIIRASRGANKLSDVHRNVRDGLKKQSTGRNADVFEVLNAYLEVVVPQIEEIEWATSIELKSGVNVMDMTGLNVEMQHLVIRSTLEWVLEKETNTVVVVPEAWKFVPQGRGTPVKLAAEVFIRQAAGLNNFLWLDSQDIAGVEKLILKQIPVWLLGVQRESNEIKRTLDQIPASIKKPKPDAVATLAIGQFFACWGTHVPKTYVQPTWLDADTARQVAMGEVPVSTLSSHRAAPDMMPLPPGSMRKTPVSMHESDAAMPTTAPFIPTPAPAMTPQQMLTEFTRMLSVAHAQPMPAAPVPPAVASPVEAIALTPPAPVRFEGDDEAKYQAFKARLLVELPADPVAIKLLTTRPELVVEVTRQILKIDGTTLPGRVGALIAADWFSTTRTHGAVKSELKRTGPDPNSGNLSSALAKLVNLGFLTKEGTEGFQAAPGMKARIHEVKP